MLSGLYAAAAVLGRDLHGELQRGSVLADRSRLSAAGALSYLQKEGAHAQTTRVRVD